MSVNPLDYIRAMFHPFVALGIVLLILWLLTRMTLLSWADLSFVVPITALGYILAALLGHFFLGEKVSRTNWIGTFLIFFGTAFVGVTKQTTTGYDGGAPE
jgi:drug/metabolite transporter (DMT)-like permease